MSSIPRRPRQLVAAMVMLLLIITMVGVTISSIQSITVGPARPATGLLTVDERTYYEFVAPRLDRLVEEVDDVVELVNRKSRDLIALSLSERRIETLTNEIATYAQDHGVPERFREVHDEMIGGTTALIDTFGDAKSALSRLKFSKMTMLIDAFNNAANELHRAQDHLHTLAGTQDAEQSDTRGMTI